MIYVVMFLFILLSATVHAEAPAPGNAPPAPETKTPDTAAPPSVPAGGAPAPAPAPGAPSVDVKTTSTASGTPEANSIEMLVEPFDYDPRGRRDPFSEIVRDQKVDEGAQHGPLLPIQQFELKELQLTGIIWNVKHPKAILRDPKGGIYVVGQNSKIGLHNGYVAAIREGEIVVVETSLDEGKLVSTTEVVHISR